MNTREIIKECDQEIKLLKAKLAKFENDNISEDLDFEKRIKKVSEQIVHEINRVIFKHILK